MPIPDFIGSKIREGKTLGPRVTRAVRAGKITVVGPTLSLTWEPIALDAVTRLLADLVSIPSVNPMGRPLAGDTFLEGRMSEYLSRWFHDLGVRVERLTVAPGRDNVLAFYEAPDSQRTLLFDAHQDTVPVDGMIIDPFRPAVESGRLYGRGSCDIKGGMTAMLLAFARLVKERPKGSASVLMACTVDEEFTHMGSSDLARYPHGADLAIVAEPTRLDLVDRHKGAVRWKIVARGVACHSSTPDRGRNAIYRMAEVVSLLAKYADELAATTSDPVLGPPTISVGRIEGGQSVNVVPDRCEVEIDRRVIPGEVLTECPALVAAYLSEKLGDISDLEFEPPWVRMPSLSPREGGSGQWVEAVRSAIETATGRRPAVGGVPFGTDAGPLSEAGLPGLVFGPGDIAQAHTEDEWVELDQVRTAVDAYYQIARDLGRG
jgi:acetylornithine deacetylase/succinyl-diaminopimelate desuccinylase family protein